MSVTIRRIAASSKWCHEVNAVSVQALADAIPAEAVRLAAHAARRPGSRERKLNLEIVLWLLISLMRSPASCAN